MLKKIRMSIIAFKIEWHWLFITSGQKKANQIVNELLMKGQSVYSPKVLVFNRRLNRRCIRVSVLSGMYNSLIYTQ